MTAFHHMIDLETIDTAPTAGILSIGIVAFNPDTGELGPTLYRRLGYDQARMYGTESADTLQWWSRQNPATRSEAFTAEHDATIAAFEVAEFIRHTAGVWGNGATFDITITEHWLNVLGAGVPYRYGMSRDCRTVEELARYIGITRKQFIRRGDHHNALDDAIYQAEYISGMWRGLTVRPVVQLPPERNEAALTFGSDTAYREPMYVKGIATGYSDALEDIKTQLDALGIAHRPSEPRKP